MNISVCTSSSPQTLTAIDCDINPEMYPSHELLEQFYKCDQLFANYEYSKTAQCCNQLMKRFTLSKSDSISIKKLTIFSYFQQNFFYKSITLVVDLLKNFNDLESRVYLSLFEKSTCLSNQVQDIKQFQGFEQKVEEATPYSNDDYHENCSTNTSLDMPNSPLSFPEIFNHGCHHIFTSSEHDSKLFSLLSILQNTKNILEIEQQLIDFVDTLQNSNLIQIILMILVLEYFNLKDSKKTLKILTILQNKYPKNPKYQACVAQIYCQFADLRNFNQTLSNMQNFNLTDFKQNILFGIEGLFVKNNSQFSKQFMDLTALYQPKLFLEENQSAFTVQTLKNTFPYYRSNLVDMIKITAYQKFISDQLVYSPNNIYIDLYFD